mmetsp:Transcript_17968/g.17160  ORF Transcript_17968/g.17160 Transcript_17968/m.17160 type:complete len:152 (+) Transcript_17968:1075-1530(+)
MIMRGDNGTAVYGGLGAPLQHGFTLKEFGDSVGVCLQYQSPDEIAEDMAEAILEKNPKKKKEDVLKDVKKEAGTSEQIRMLLFKDGICVSSTDQKDPNKMKLDPAGVFYVFIGADGPCKLSLNVGGKIFRAHHDEVNKGLIASGGWIGTAS